MISNNESRPRPMHPNSKQSSTPKPKEVRIGATGVSRVGQRKARDICRPRKRIRQTPSRRMREAGYMTTHFSAYSSPYWSIPAISSLYFCFSLTSSGNHRLRKVASSLSKLSVHELALFTTPVSQQYLPESAPFTVLCRQSGQFCCFLVCIVIKQRIQKTCPQASLTGRHSISMHVGQL
jgi:hypothetical protein